MIGPRGVLQLPARDLVRLYEDEERCVSRATDAAVAAALRFDVARDELCGTLWELAGTAAYPALPHVVRLFAHPDPRVRRFALIAVRGLHPLAGIPSVLDVAPTTGSSTFMTEWLKPRSSFVRGLRQALASSQLHQGQLASSLARLAGEHEVVRQCLEEGGAEGTVRSYLEQYETARARRAPKQLIVALTYRCNRKCPYCYAYESQSEQTADIDFDTALGVLDWAKAEGATQVSFTGGEPTHHPRFAALVEEVRRRGLGLYLNTNGLFGSEVCDALATETTINVGFHVSERKLHRRGELETISRNIQALNGAGIDVFIRHTLWRSNRSDLLWLVDFAVKHELRHLNLALGFPGRTGTNRHIANDALLDARDVYFEALRLAADRGLRVRTSKPVPLCLYTPEEYAHFQRFHELASTCTVHDRGGVHNVVVNPDASTYPCVGLPFKGPRLEAGRGYEAVAAHCDRHIRRSLEVVQSDCARCAVYSTGTCQGSCLGHGCRQEASNGTVAQRRSRELALL